MELNPFHSGCAGCQICIEHMLEGQWGPEWWAHPDNQQLPEVPNERAPLWLTEGEPPQ